MIADAEAWDDHLAWSRACTILVPGLHYIGPKDHLISSRPLKMVREGSTYLSIVVTILQTPQNSPEVGKARTEKTGRDERCVSAAFSLVPVTAPANE